VAIAPIVVSKLKLRPVSRAKPGLPEEELAGGGAKRLGEGGHEAWAT
jgi:hypothetical protein